MSLTMNTLDITTNCTDPTGASKVLNCNVCYTNPVEQDRRANITSRCNHPIETCSDCIQSWLESQLDAVGTNLTCPGCNESLEYGEVRQFAGQDQFQRYDRLLLTKLLSMSGDFRWCASTSCPSGQHVDCGDYFDCANCKARNCVHHATIHIGESCDGFQKRMDESHETSSSATLIAEISKPCPQCAVRTEKNGGCDHISCSECQKQWCWICQCDWTLASGNAQLHDITCKHHSDISLQEFAEEELRPSAPVQTFHAVYLRLRNRHIDSPDPVFPYRGFFAFMLDQHYALTFDIERMQQWSLTVDFTIDQQLLFEGIMDSFTHTKNVMNEFLLDCYSNGEVDSEFDAVLAQTYLYALHDRRWFFQQHDTLWEQVQHPLMSIYLPGMEVDVRKSYSTA